MAKRRTFSPELKFEAVLDMVRGEKTVAQICRERDLSEALLYKWRDAFFERAPGIFADQRRHPTSHDPQAERIAELERLVGRQTLEIEVLKKARSLLASAPKKNGVSSGS
jgi:transposase